MTDLQGAEPKLITDIRRILDDKSVDAVVMATPIHWHAAGTILACDAGKDVYVEKPASHNICEGRLMVEAARRNRRIVQLGTQSRSRPVTERLVQYAQSGKLGRVLMVKVGNVQKRRDSVICPISRCPRCRLRHLDRARVAASVQPQSLSRHRELALALRLQRYRQRWSALIDIARWLLRGRRLYFDDDQQTPDTMNIMFNYPNKVLFFEQRHWNGYRIDGTENSVIAFGTDAVAILGRWVGGHYEFRVFDSGGKMISSDREPSPDFTYHARNFIDCVKSRKTPNADTEGRREVNQSVHLGNIVARTGQPVKFEPKTEKVSGAADANRYVAARVPPPLVDAKARIDAAPRIFRCRRNNTGTRSRRVGHPGRTRVRWARRSHLSVHRSPR